MFQELIYCNEDSFKGPIHGRLHGQVIDLIHLQQGAEHTKDEGIPQYIYPYSVYYLYLVLKNNILVLM